VESPSSVVGLIAVRHVANIAGSEIAGRQRDADAVRQATPAPSVKVVPDQRPERRARSWNRRCRAHQSAVRDRLSIVGRGESVATGVRLTGDGTARLGVRTAPDSGYRQQDPHRVPRQRHALGHIGGGACEWRSRTS